MTITEKASYLKGLADGLSLDKNTPEGKIIASMIDLIDDMALTISDLDDSVDALSEEVDQLDEALSDALSDEDEDDEDEEEVYEVVCPSCGKTICLSESVLDDGEMLCPNCGEKLEFDFDDDDDCDCGCCHPVESSDSEEK